MIETPKMFPGRKFQLFNFIWRSNYFEQQNTDRHNSSNILIPCLYLSRGQNPCWQTTQKSKGETFGPCKTVFGGGWIHWTGSNSFTRSATQRCFSPLLWFSNHSFSDRCTSQLSQLCSRFGPKIVAFCLLRQLSRRRAEDEALTYTKNWYRPDTSTKMLFSPHKWHTQVPAVDLHSSPSWPLHLYGPHQCCGYIWWWSNVDERKMGNEPLRLPQI